MFRICRWTIHKTTVQASHDASPEQPLLKLTADDTKQKITPIRPIYMAASTRHRHIRCRRVGIRLSLLYTENGRQTNLVRRNSRVTW
jgi:hypothetical protein